MRPPFDETHNSGVAPAAPGIDAEESQEPEPSVPAGEPEAPVSPTAPAEEDPDAEPTPEPESEPPHDPEDHETKLEHDLDELTAKAEKADEYLELAQRTKADFENYRKRAARETAAAQQRGVVKLVRELLPAVDNLDRGLDPVGSAEPSINRDQLAAGLKLEHAEVIAALARAGVERFSPERERF